MPGSLRNNVPELPISTRGPMRSDMSSLDNDRGRRLPSCRPPPGAPSNAAPNMHVTSLFDSIRPTQMHHFRWPAARPGGDIHARDRSQIRTLGSARYLSRPHARRLGVVALNTRALHCRADLSGSTVSTCCRSVSRSVVLVRTRRRGLRRGECAQPEKP